ncbi:SpoIID/LytB domain-containing protein [bacterium]|nr:SpoIID/LytB domain-containing protein [bacterium]UNM08287.1 MAG: SpoIID/LytB domain-containing protein [Planctomycetales bacterium]
MKLRTTACLLFALALLASGGLPASAQSEQMIRVVIDDTAASAGIKGDMGWSTVNGPVRSSANPAEVKVNAGKLRLVLDGGSYDSTRFIAMPQSGYVQYGGRGYRGHIELFVGKNGNVVVLNVLPLEEYLYGVVPSEMSPSWPFEALKSQAVAARTYALSRIMANMERTYDVYGNVSDQAYKGVSGEHDTSTRAVQETTGQVIDYHGQVITAFYCACAGGMTKQGTEPYLRSVPTDHPDSPHHGWEVTISLEDLSRMVKDSGADIGPIKDVTAEYDANSGHLLSLIVHGANDSKQLFGTTLRKLVGRSRMKSTRCRIYPAGGTPQPVIASAPQGQVHHAPESSVVNVATEVSVSGASYTDSDGNYATQESFGWLKPWVASADMQVMVKMRNMFAYDGSSLMQCNRDMHMLSAQDGGAVATMASAGGAPAATVPAEPLPAVEVVNARMSRSELSGGLVIRGDGYGHGLGMSQWGARKLAEDGLDYQAILKYFYTGVDIVSLQATPLMPGEQPDIDEVEDQGGFYDAFTAVELD